MHNEAQNAMQAINDTINHDCDPDYIREKAESRYKRTWDSKFLQLIPTKSNKNTIMSYFPLQNMNK